MVVMAVEVAAAAVVVVVEVVLEVDVGCRLLVVAGWWLLALFKLAVVVVIDLFALPCHLYRPMPGEGSRAWSQSHEGGMR